MADCLPFAPRPALLRNFSWVLVGNVVYEVCQWLNLVILARMLSVSEVGVFALALAIAAPVAILSSMNLSAIQVTDTEGDFSFREYVTTALVGRSAAFLVVLAIGVVAGYPSEVVLVMAAVAGGHFVLGLRNTYHAYCQKMEQMEMVGVSKAVTGLLSLVFVAVTLAHTGSLLWGVVAMQVAKLLVVIGWDIPASARVAKGHGELNLPALGGLFGVPVGRIGALVRVGAPLGVGAFLFSLYPNTPKIAVEQLSGVDDLGYYAAVMALVIVGKQVTQAAGFAALPRLTTYAGGEMSRFWRLMRRLIGVALLISVAGAAIAAVIGGDVLRLTFGPEYAPYAGLLVHASLAATTVFVAQFLKAGILATRAFNASLVCAGLGVSVLVSAVVPAVKLWGLFGAVYALSLGFGVYSAAVLFVLFRASQAGSPAGSGSSSQPTQDATGATP